ncbi:MAG: hypothetical protein JWO86_5769 [Myxococcaceae bacterium]|nr:hypothetical protein [Myxococcaceae bacterium]
MVIRRQRTMILTTIVLSVVGGVHSFCAPTPGTPPPTVTFSPTGVLVHVGETAQVTARSGDASKYTVAPGSDCSSFVGVTLPGHVAFDSLIVLTGKAVGTCTLLVDASGFTGATSETTLGVTVLPADDPGPPTKDASTDAPVDAPIDAPVAAPPTGHLYVSDRVGGKVSRFDVFGSTTTASPHGSFASLLPTGMAFGPAGILYVGNVGSGGIERFADAKNTATHLTALAVPPSGAWSPSGVLFLPTAGGAGELWVASEAMSDKLVVYPLDNAGAATGPAVAVPTGLADAGGHGIQGLAFDSASSSFFVAADQVRRLKLVRGSGTWTLSPVTDAALSPLGASNPVGLAMASNRWLIATYPVPSFVNVAYWSVDDPASTFVGAASGMNNTFSPLGIAILPSQPATPPIRVYTGTQESQIVALDVAASGVPALDNLVCGAPASSWVVAGD